MGLDCKAAQNAGNGFSIQTIFLSLTADVKQQSGKI